MLLKARRARQTSYGMGVSNIFSSFISYQVLMPRTNSTPVALQYEKFHIPTRSGFLMLSWKLFLISFVLLIISAFGKCRNIRNHSVNATVSMTPIRRLS